MQQELLEIKKEIDAAFLFKKEIDEEKLKAQEKQDRIYALEVIKKIPELIRKAAKSNQEIVIVSQIGSNENEAKKGAYKFILEILEELQLNPTVQDLHYNDGFAICFKI